MQKKDKRGISLIILVITIIVLIIIAGTVIISLTDVNIVDRANETVSAARLKDLQNGAMLASSDYALEDRNTLTLKAYVIQVLKEKYDLTDEELNNITVSDNGSVSYITNE